MKNNNLILKKLSVDEETELGASHFLGCPDVPAKWNDEAVFFNDEVFVCQINLSQIFLEGLPNRGMLYFFFASLSRPYRGIVRYANDLTELERTEFNQEVEFDANFDQEYAIEFTNDVTNLKLLTEEKQKNYHLQEDEIVLLKINTSEYPDIDLLKNVNNELCYIIKKKDLKDLNFSNVYLTLKKDF